MNFASIGPMACGSTVVANRELLEKRIYTQYRHTAGLDMDFTRSFMWQITEVELLNFASIGPMACGSTVVANRELLEKRIYTQYRHTAGLDMDFTRSFMWQITQTIPARRRSSQKASAISPMD